MSALIPNLTFDQGITLGHEAILFLGVVTSGLGVYSAWALRSSKRKVDEIHVSVNGNLAAALAEVERLRDELARKSA